MLNHNESRTIPRREADRIVREISGPRYKDVMYGDLTRDVVVLRVAAIRALAERFPNASSREIGSVIGRDYTTVMHHLGRRSGRGAGRMAG